MQRLCQNCLGIFTHSGKKFLSGFYGSICLAKIGAFIVSLVELKSKILFSYANSKGGVFQWLGNYHFTGRSVKTTHFTMLIDESLLNSSLTGGGRGKWLFLLMLSHQP